MGRDRTKYVNSVTTTRLYSSRAPLLVARASLLLIFVSNFVIAASIAAILSSRLESTGRSSRILGYETTGAM